MPDEIPYVVEPMALADIDEVMEIERASFPLPWPARAYRYEILNNDRSTMLVVKTAIRASCRQPGLTRLLRAVTGNSEATGGNARSSRTAWAWSCKRAKLRACGVPLPWRWRLAHRQSVLGYAGCWHLVDEIHVSTIAVHPHWRGRGLGQLLLLSLLEQGASQSALRATLEVRVSNLPAQALYRKYGFEVVSRQRRYYADNNEDAYIMATPEFGSSAFEETLRRAHAQLYARLKADGPAGGVFKRPRTTEVVPSKNTR